MGLCVCLSLECIEKVHAAIGKKINLSCVYFVCCSIKKYIPKSSVGGYYLFSFV